MRIVSVVFLVTFTVPMAAHQHRQLLDKLAARTRAALQVSSPLCSLCLPFIDVAGHNHDVVMYDEDNITQIWWPNTCHI